MHHSPATPDPETTGGDGQLLLRTSRFAVQQVRYRGREGRILERAVIRHPGAVVLLPLVDAEHVCLIRNRRVAVGETLIELPAGTRELSEAAEVTAARELIEETGFQARRIRWVRKFYLSPGILDESMHLFVASGLDAIGTDRQPDEEIDNLVVPWETALQMAADGRIKDAKSLIGIWHLQQLGGPHSFLGRQE